jgi:atypical dual specificity phosphatase
MSEPYSFSWIDPGRLAAMGCPDDPETLAWLRQQGIELVITLTEEPLRRDWLTDAGLLALHVPIGDMTAPTFDQIEACVSALRKAKEQGMGVAIHCFAGKGRTGTILAAYFVDRGLSPEEAIARIRELRPGSIETDEQIQAVQHYARSRKQTS